jgi:hypothetical protein
MHDVQNPGLEAAHRIEGRILETLADGTVLVGTMSTLSHALGVRRVDLRAVLRSLLQARKIAIATEARGQLTIRLERRVNDSLPPRPPAIERRRPRADVWIL